MSISVTFESGNTDPRIVRIRTTSTFAEVTTAGWYSQTPPNQLLPSDKVEIYYGEGSGSAANGFFDVSITAGVVTLTVAESNVVLPVVDGDFAVFSGTSGAIQDLGYLPSDASKTRVVMLSNTNSTTNYIAQFMDTDGTIGFNTADAIHLGNIVAGNAALPGTFISTAGTLAGGTFIFKHVSNGSSFNATISPISSLGQSAVYTIPDPGQATSSFLLSNSAGTQTIDTGSLTLTLGNLTVAAGNIVATLGSISAGTTVTGGTGVVATTGNVTASAGNVVAGAAAAAGTVTSFSGTGTNEFLRLAAVDNAGGDFSTTISNAASVGQSQTVSIPDVGAATGNFIAAGAALVSGEFPVLTGTGGRVVSSGVAAANLQDKTNIKAATTADIGGAGAGPISVVVAGLTAASVVVATIASSSNVVAVGKCIATATGFDITFTGDPGASAVVNYVAFIVSQ